MTEKMYHTICKTCANQHDHYADEPNTGGLEIVHTEYKDGLQARGYHGYFHQGHDMITRRIA